MSDVALETDRSSIQVIDRAIAVLRSLEGAHEGLSLAEIARTVELPRTTVHRIVSSLSDHGFLVAANPNSRVRLGPGILQLANSVDYDLKDILNPFIKDLNREIGDTVDLAILKGGSAVFIDQVQGRARLVALSVVGSKMPLHCTANGKAILAELPPGEMERALDRSLREHPDHPLADREALIAEIDKVRQTHIAFDREEHAPGIGAAGFALRDAAGTLFAISVPMPIQRFKRTEKKLTEIVLAHRNKIASKISLGG